MRGRSIYVLTGVETVADSGGVDEVSPAESADEVRIDLTQLDPGLIPRHLCRSATLTRG